MSAQAFPAGSPFGTWWLLPGVEQQPLGAPPPAAVTPPVSAASYAARQEAASQLVWALALGLAGAMAYFALKRRGR